MRTVTPRICHTFFLYLCAVKGKELVAHIKDLFNTNPESMAYEGRKKFVPK